MPKFYSGKGDDGYTGLLGEGRVPKNHPRTEAVGALDEASAAMGLARVNSQGQLTQEVLLRLQREFYQLMSEISATAENASRFRAIDENKVSWLEGILDQLSAEVPMPREFIVPGDTPAGAALALARTIIRRAERQVVSLVQQQMLENKQILRYLNRTSSLLFVLELYENALSGKATPTLAREE